MKKITVVGKYNFKGLLVCLINCNKAWYFLQGLYKTQAEELKEELDDKCRSVSELEEERSSLAHQLQLALARGDSEALARSIAEETVADLEKEKTMKELELKDLINKHRTDQIHKEATLNAVSKQSFICLLKLYFAV